MTKVLTLCPDCFGNGTVVHHAAPLQEGEIRDPNNLDQYKSLDTCEHCNGTGRRLVEVEVKEGGA